MIPPDDALADLLVLLPPPDEPAFGAVDAWETVAADLGTHLPADYVAFIERYGSCEIDQYLGISDPREGDFVTSFVRRFAETYRAHREDDPDTYWMKVWPEPEGFIPWAHTQNGDYVGWLTIGHPDTWPIAMYPPRGDDTGAAIPLSATQTLAAWLRGTLRSNHLLPVEDPVCEPWT
ncbi:SMI1/KNR4 family protein [Actinomadura sp. 3N508]|uniref:SMI1/KNR4 family protein n=1 Tax=Actinomadura sp. 3N508 TaxID=3375153 RepID=UPI0037AD785B